MAEDTKAADKAADDKADDKADTKAASKVIKDDDGKPVMAFGSWDEAAAQAKALGKHSAVAVGTAVAVVPDSD